MSISLDDVAKSYGRSDGKFALNGVTAEIPSGSLTAILGPSGSGKSTLLKVIAGLEQPDRGRVCIEGDDVTDLDARFRGIGFCFQQYAPFRHLTVEKNIAYGLKVRRRPRAEISKKVAEMLELVQLGDFAKRYPAQLSGGQRQRMALARALAIEPRVLLLDEPFGALDAQVRAELRTWVKNLHDQVPITTIMVTHDQSEAMEVASQLVVLRDGRIEQTGAPGELYDHPATPFVHEFLGPTTTVGGEVVRPHDLVLRRQPGPGHQGKVTGVVALGFEVRVEVALDDGSSCWVQLTAHEFAELTVTVGDAVAVSPR